MYDQIRRNTVATEIDIAIIGGGVIGLATAYTFSRYFQSKNINMDICLLEKHKIPGENQSSHNSGVVHAGIYYPVTSEPLKAKLCVTGNQKLADFCKEHQVPYEKTGKLAVAINSLEEEYLDDLYQTAVTNKVPDVQHIPGNEAARFEPNVKALSALYFPTSGIVETTHLLKKLYQLSKANDVYLLEGHEVTGIVPQSGKFTIETICRQSDREYHEVFEARWVINCGGLYADELAKMVNPDFPYEIIPTRGEIAKFNKRKKDGLWMNRMNVYPAPYGYYNDTGCKAEVPFPEYQRLLRDKTITRTVGVHLSPTFDLDLAAQKYIIGDTVIIGPAKTVGVAKDDYTRNLKDEAEFFNKVKSFFPNVTLADIEKDYTGIMAVVKGHPDFVIEPDCKYPNMITVIADSPGLTASLAIAEYVLDLYQ
jgi:L-2-hydroxyglutarate oxidase LhgO